MYIYTIILLLTAFHYIDSFTIDHKALNYRTNSFFLMDTTESYQELKMSSIFLKNDLTRNLTYENNLEHLTKAGYKTYRNDYCIGNIRWDKTECGRTGLCFEGNLKPGSDGGVWETLRKSRTSPYMQVLVCDVNEIARGTCSWGDDDGGRTCDSECDDCGMNTRIIMEDQPVYSVDCSLKVGNIIIAYDILSNEGLINLSIAQMVFSCIITILNVCIHFTLKDSDDLSETQYKTQYLIICVKAFFSFISLILIGLQMTNLRKAIEYGTVAQTHSGEEGVQISADGCPHNALEWVDFAIENYWDLVLALFGCINDLFGLSTKTIIGWICCFLGFAFESIDFMFK